MITSSPSILTRSAFTVLAVAIATLLRYSLNPLFGEGLPFITYYPAVVLCAWYGGFWQGVLSTVLGGIGALYIFLAPQYAIALLSKAQSVQLSLFLTASVLISLLAETLHRARKKAEANEAKAREQSEQFRVTLNSIGDAVIATDGKGKVSFINPVAETLTGWKGEEALGKPVDEVFQVVNEQTRNKVINPALRAIQEGVIVGLANHTVLISKNKTETPIDDSGAPLKDSEGKVYGSVLVFRDITNRRKAEREHALLAEIVQSSEDAIISKSLDGIIESWNSAAERMFGYSADEAIGNPITIIIPPERREEEERIIERLRQGERIKPIETVRRTKDGRLLDISLCVSPVLNPEGEIIGASKISRDITNQKRSRRELLENRERLQITLSSIGDAVITTDTEGRVTFLNPVAESLTGWKREEADGRPLEDVFQIINEQTRKIVANPAIRAMTEGLIVGLANHTILRAKDGTEIPIDDSGAPIKDADGNILGSVLIFRDITDRRLADERFRLVVEAAPNAMVMVDDEGRIILVNSQTERLFGYRRDELIGKPIELLVPERFRKQHPEYRAGFSRVPQARPMGAGRDLFGLHRDGSEVPIEIGLNPLEVKGKTFVLSSIVDISARQRAEEERARLLASEHDARERAEAASRAKDEFVAMISHEIRSPLNAILGWAQMLRTGKLDKAGRERAVETIERNAKSQVQIVEDLMDISRVISGKLNLNVRPVEPAQIVEAAIDSIRPAAEAKAIQIGVHIDSKNTLFLGDHNRLQQIVWNLLSNAVKFTPRFGRIEINVKRIDSSMEISVKDTGAGIEPEFLPYVFDRFSQASTGSERKHGGLGLGLAIVRHLVELHGGSVKADSAGVGQGATFTVSLPVGPERADATQFGGRAVSFDQSLSLSSVKILEGLKILVVDDEVETRELLTAILTGRGAEVIVCGSAAEALTRLPLLRPNILISDIGMPEEDGYSLIKKVRELGPEQCGNIPAVALTAYARSEDRLRALAAGFQMHVPKPVEAFELIMVLASLTGRISKV